MNNGQQIQEKIEHIYNEIVKWKKNIFKLPRGKAGRDFISELTRLINLFNYNTAWKNHALSLVHIYVPMMLQKPSKRSKARDNAKYLSKRLNLWHGGKLNQIMQELREIQKRIKIKVDKNIDEKKKAFCRFMLQGKVAKAVQFIDNGEGATQGVLPATKDNITKLQQKHPAAGPLNKEHVVLHTSDPVEAVVFEEIDADLITRTARNISGSGGPTQVDADIWRYIICSKVYGNLSSTLAEAIADLAKILCTELIPPDLLKELLASRLIPLDKNPGIRPIGIGEVLRRIISKSVTTILRSDIQLSAGTLQTCSGIQSGIEAAVHAMQKTFNKEESEAILLVDASNAFNALNRSTALENIKQICPPIYQFLQNCYQSPTKLHIPQSEKTPFILSQEGTTQGAPAAMAMYALGTRPLMDSLSSTLDEATNQVFFADDASAAGHIETIFSWWKKICEIGPKFGYFPNASKCVLIVKNEEAMKKAQTIFGPNCKIEFTLYGERHLGAVVGSPAFKEEYVQEKVRRWIQDVAQLAQLAEEEPQLAYAAYTKGLCHRWKYVQRTIPDISHLFAPLETEIRRSLIPALTGRPISDSDRVRLALPLRYGGLGIQDPTDTSDTEYSASTYITEELTELILSQDPDIQKLNHVKMKEKRSRVKAEREKKFQEVYASLYTSANDQEKKALEMSREKGSYSWLSALPIQELGYTLNKVEFQDALSLRFNWRLQTLPKKCGGCGSKNDTDHALSCKTGGYVSFRHDAIRDVEAELLKEVCRDVRTEPPLQRTKGDMLRSTANTSDQARLDIAATGLWSRFERTYFDVRVTHPNAPSNRSKTLKQLYIRNEEEKMVKYAQRVINTEKGSFCPLVYSTFGGTAPQCSSHHKRVAQLMAHKRKDKYEDIINFIRIRVRFALLKSVLMALRGVRGVQKINKGIPISTVEFGLIPREEHYEV